MRFFVVCRLSFSNARKLWFSIVSSSIRRMSSLAEMSFVCCWESNISPLPRNNHSALRSGYTVSIRIIVSLLMLVSSSMNRRMTPFDASIEFSKARMLRFENLINS